MKLITKKMLTVLLVLTMLLGCGLSAMAADGEQLDVAKNAEKVGDGIYKVTLTVPGEDASGIHDEVILMVDGSYSGDDEWESMVDTIVTIGETVLNGNGNTALTLMAFGMGDNEVLVGITDAAELESALGELPGSLLYGRSSTNCESGLTGVGEYLEENGGMIDEAFVFFISDGEINTDETPYDFYNWKENTWLRWSAETIMGANISAEIAAEKEGADYSDAYKSVYGNDDFVPAEAMPDFTAAAEENVAKQSGTDEEAPAEEPGENQLSEEELAAQEASAAQKEAERQAAIAAEKARLEAEWLEAQKMNAWSAQVWADVYAYAGLDPEKEYPVSEVERAFVTYDKDHNTYLQDNFYYALVGRSYPDRTNRTIVAAELLADTDKVEQLYIVDSNRTTAWMETVGSSKENAEFIPAGSVANIIPALENTLATLAKTPFNDVVLTDYMSKWINLDTTSIAVVDSSTETTIYTTADGWLIEESLRPTADENPVIIQEVSAEEYSLGGEAVEGNESGLIQRLIWKVKDGALLRSDNYRLEYLVTVDEGETGYVPGSDYPANGTTQVSYTDEDGAPQTEDIKVPDVTGPSWTLTVNYVDVNGRSLTDSIVTDGFKKGDEYTTELKSFYRYDLVRTEGDPVSGEIQGDTVVTYVYQRYIVIVPDPEPTPTPTPIPTPTPTPEPEVSPEPTEPPVVDIPDEEPPMAEPEEPVVTPEPTEPVAPVYPPVIIIEDEIVPLAEMPDEDVPQTGDNSGILAVICAASAVLLLALCLVWRKPGSSRR